MQVQAPEETAPVRSACSQALPSATTGYEGGEGGPPATEFPEATQRERCDLLTDNLFHGWLLIFWWRFICPSVVKISSHCPRGDPNCMTSRDCHSADSESRILMFKIPKKNVFNTIPKYTWGELTCLPQSFFKPRWQEEQVTVRLKDKQYQPGPFTPTS